MTVYRTVCECLVSGPEPEQDTKEWVEWDARWMQRAYAHHVYCCQRLLDSGELFHCLEDDDSGCPVRARYLTALLGAEEEGSMLPLNAAIAFAVSLPKGTVREGSKWVWRIRNARSQAERRRLATRFFRLHKPEEEWISSIMNWIEADCPA
jgi:hypothetical protein